MDDMNQKLLLELIDRPVLCVENGVVTCFNQAAAQLHISVGTPIEQFLPNDYEAYTNYSDGQLYLNLTIAGIDCGAIVIRSGQTDYFIFDQDEDFAKLQSIALAAQQLRIPLSNVMTLTDRFLAHKDLEEVCSLREQAKQINKGLFQLLRIISNMADAHKYVGRDPLRMQTVNFTALLTDIFKKAQTLISDTGIKLDFTGLDHPVIGLANEEYLERGIYNLVANAVKFSPKGSTVSVKLSHTKDLLSVSIQDQGSGISPDIRTTLFTRYRRTPGIEDGRHGIGLGMTIARAAATAHGGTILVDQPQECGTRVTLTVAIRQTDSGTVRTPILNVYDYTGGWDHALVELSESLSADTYDQ